MWLKFIHSFWLFSLKKSASDISLWCGFSLFPPLSEIFSFTEGSEWIFLPKIIENISLNIFHSPPILFNHRFQWTNPTCYMSKVSKINISLWCLHANIEWATFALAFATEQHLLWKPTARWSAHHRVGVGTLRRSGYPLEDRCAKRALH